MNAVKKYYESPNLCKHCGLVIHVISNRANDARRKIFCSKSCSASFNNKGVVRNKRVIKDKCLCGNNKTKKSNKCNRCFRAIFQNKTLKDLLGDDTRYSTVKLNGLRASARINLEKNGINKTCSFCKTNEFDEVVEACHIKGVMEFDLSEKIETINDIKNLMWLCPSHHKMFDKKLIKIV